MEIVHHCVTRHGDALPQSSIAFAAHAVDLSLWQEVQGFGILYLSVIAGVMNLNVWDETNAPANTLAFDFRHVAGHTLASRTTRLVVSMFFETRDVRTIRGIHAVAVQADLVGRLAKLRLVLVP